MPPGPALLARAGALRGPARGAGGGVRKGGGDAGGEDAGAGAAAARSVHSQVHFSGAADCDGYVPHFAKPTLFRCTACAQQLEAHRAEAVPEAQVLLLVQSRVAGGESRVLRGADAAGLPPGAELWLGSMKVASPEFARERGLTHIASCAKGLRSFFPKWARRLPDVEAMGVEIRDVEWDDVASFVIWPGPSLPEAVRWVSAALQQGGRVGVHCAQGKSRSTTLVVAYLVAAAGLTVDAALQFVRRARMLAEPNPGFMAQLRAFERSGECAALREELPHITVSG